MYRGIYAAVKKLHAKSALQDVVKCYPVLSHLFLPYLLGVCTSNKPFKIITLFHGFLGDLLGSAPSWIDWISASAQILEAFIYLHDEVEILHNDFTSTNVLLGHPTSIKYL